MGGIVVNLPKPVWYVLHIFTACCLALAAITDIIFLAWNEARWSIHSGFSVERYTAAVNMGFYLNISVLCWCIISILLAIVEIGLMLDVKFFERFRIAFVRPVIYIIMGVATLGVCADLGIATGTLTIIAGIVWLIIEILSALGQ